MVSIQSHTERKVFEIDGSEYAADVLVVVVVVVGWIAGSSCVNISFASVASEESAALLLS